MIQIDNSALTFDDHCATSPTVIWRSPRAPCRCCMVRMVAQQRAAVFDYSVSQFHCDDTQRPAGITSGLIPLQRSSGTTDYVSWLVNLILNGVDAMPEGGTLTVRTYSVNERVVVEISDTGIGSRQHTRTPSSGHS